MNTSHFRNILVLVFMFYQTFSFSQTRLDDSLSLVDLYNSTNGTSWTTTWNLTTPMDGWYGVFLTNGRVTCLDLDDVPDCASDLFWSLGNNLSGPIPDLNLTKLKELHLGKNPITDSIPDFSKMPLLEKLYMHRNYTLTGNIPDFTNLGELQVLNLYHSGLTGVPDFSKIPKLQELNLAKNNLSGNVLDYSNLPDLKILNLVENQFSGPVPDFSNLHQLSFLALNGNQLTGNIPDFNLPNLTFLHIRRNQLMGQLPDFTNLPILEELWLDENQFSGNITDFTNLLNLKKLVLERNNLSGSIPDFSHLISLRELNVSHNQLKGGIPDFSNMPSLIMLRLKNNQLSGSIPNFTKAIKLESLYFENNKLSGNIPDFSSLNNLRWLFFSNNELTGGIPDFSNKPILTTLYLGDNKLSGHFPIISNTNLGYVEIQRNQFTFENLIDSYPYYDSLIVNYSYFPQDKVGFFNTVCGTPNLPTTIQLSFDDTVTTSTYYWFKNGAPYDTTTLNALNFSSIQPSDFGSYHCEVINPHVPGLRLVTYPIHLTLGSRPEIEVCNYTYNSTSYIEDSLTITLVCGTPPWSFDLIQQSELSIDTTALTVYDLDTTLYKVQNTIYFMENLISLADSLVNTNQYFGAYIDGCTQVCTGYDSTYTELYYANFPTPASNYYWSVYPQSALSNGSVAIVGGQTSNTLELRFSTLNPIDTEITLYLTADTDCGAFIDGDGDGWPDQTPCCELISKTIVLDKNCVWPGDVNNDGQDTSNTVLSYVEDVIYFHQANLIEEWYNHPWNSSDLTSYKRAPKCLATQNYEWFPQSANDWTVQDISGNSSPAIFWTVDIAGNQIDPVNLKFADCNGDGALIPGRNWTPNIPIDSVQYPTDHDIIAYNAHRNKTHNGNSQSFNNTSPSQLLEIKTNRTVLNNGDQLIMSIFLGSDSKPVENVNQVGFVGEGQLGVYRRPTLSLDSSNFDLGKTDFVDYSFFNTHDDSLDIYASIARKDSSCIDFTGQEVGRIICIVQPVELGIGNAFNKSPLDSVPVTFQITSAGISHNGDSISYAISNEINVWVRPAPVLNARVFLQGASQHLDTLMKDDLRAQNYLPLVEPYYQMPGFYYPQPEMKGLQILDSAALSVSGNRAIVDWVFVEIRDALTDKVVMARAALLTRAGTIVDIDGVSPVELYGLYAGHYKVSIRHRNHLPVMTVTTQYLSRESVFIDFTSGNNQTLQHQLPCGKYAMVAGDIQSDNNYIGKHHNIDALDRSSVWNVRNQFGYLRGDANLSGVTEASDRSIIWNNRNQAVILP